MLRNIDQFYLLEEEPVKSCLVALREFIFRQDKEITASWNYGMPFFYYRGKRFCYLWVHKKLRQPYVGFVDGKYLSHPKLVSEKRARMKIYLIDPEKDLPVKTLKTLLKQSIDLYKKGSLK